VTKYLRSDDQIEIARVTFKRPWPKQVAFKGKVSVAIHFGAPAFGKHAKGFGVPVGFFKHASDYVGMVVDGFEKL
jgi:hypothetical protein